MAPCHTVLGSGGRAFHFPSFLMVLVAGLTALLTGGCAGQPQVVLPPLSPELVSARFGLGAVRTFAWTADGATMVAAGDAERLFIIDARTRRFRGVIPCDGPIRSLAVTDQTAVVGTARGTVARLSFVDAGLEKPLASIAAGSPVTSVAVDPSGTQAAVACENGQVLLWDLKTSSPTGTRSGAHTGAARAVAFATDGKTLYSAGDDGVVRALAVPALTDLKSTPSQGTRLLSLAVAADGRVVTGGEDGGVRVLDGRSLGVNVRYSDLQGPIHCLATHGPLVAAGSTNQRVAVWKLDSEAHAVMLQSTSVQNASGAFHACAFTPDGKAVAAGGDDRVIIAQSLDTRTPQPPVFYGVAPVVRSLALSPDDKTVATVGSGPDVLLWETETRALKAVVSVKDAHGDAQSVAWAENGLIATGTEDGSVSLIDPTRDTAVSGVVPADAKGATPQVNTVAFSGDGRLLASGGWDGRVHLWSAAPGALTHKAALSGHTNGISAVAFAADGATLASSSWDQTVRVWSVESGTEKTRFGGMSGPIFSVGLGSKPALVAGGWHGQVWVWNPESGANDFRKNEQTDVVFCLAFSRDGRWVASGSADRTVWLYDLEQGMSPQAPHIGDFRSPVHGVAWTRDAARIVIGTAEGDLFVLPSQIPGGAAPAPTPSAARPAAEPTAGASPGPTP